MKFSPGPLRLWFCGLIIHLGVAITLLGNWLVVIALKMAGLGPLVKMVTKKVENPVVGAEYVERYMKNIQ